MIVKLKNTASSKILLIDGSEVSITICWSRIEDRIDTTGMKLADERNLAWLVFEMPKGEIVQGDWVKRVKEMAELSQNGEEFLDKLRVAHGYS